MTELACPEACPYLQEARAHASQRRSERIIRHLIEQDKRDLFERIRNLEPIIYRIEKAVVEVQRKQFRDLTDQEALEGLESALQTAETLGRGIIYEHKPRAPRSQAVTEAILRGIEEIKAELQKHGQSRLLTSDEVTSCLAFVREWMRLEMSSEGHAYLHQTALHHPYPEDQTRLIVTP